MWIVFHSCNLVYLLKLRIWLFTSVVAENRWNWFSVKDFFFDVWSNFPFKGNFPYFWHTQYTHITLLSVRIYSVKTAFQSRKISEKYDTIVSRLKEIESFQTCIESLRLWRVWGWKIFLKFEWKIFTTSLEMNAMMNEWLLSLYLMSYVVWWWDIWFWGWRSRVQSTV